MSGSDETGMPLDPLHPWNQTDDPPEIARERFIRRELRRMENGWRAGVGKALADAVRFSQEMDIAPHKWVVDGVESAVAGETRKGRGRGSYDEDMKDFVRWDTVIELQEHLRGAGEWKSWEDLFFRTVEALEETPYGGSFDTIKKAYNRVQKRGVAQPGRYYI